MGLHSIKRVTSVPTTLPHCSEELAEKNHLHPVQQARCQREAPKVTFWYHESSEKHCVVKETSAMTFEDFEELFGVCGKNTAKSRKAIVQTREYANLDEIKELFGQDIFPELVQVKQWKKRAFGKSCVVDELDVPGLGMTAKYNRTKMNVEMVFRLEDVM